MDVPAQTLLFKEPQVSPKSQAGFQTVGLFAGIGGIELGLRRAGWHTDLLCEIDPYAREVLSRRFEVPVDEIVGDVRELRGLPKVTLLAGGFPCQDLSQAGRTAGIKGAKSGLVGEVFRLLEECTPRWLLLENVPFMLRLDAGKAMAFLASSLESLGYTWAYRVVDTRSFGLPHRRKRVLMVASRSEDPRGALLNEDAGEPKEKNWEGRANGFCWTEGLRGVGWGIDCVPTLKCGSTLSIPSPPAIWLPEGSGTHAFVTPTIEDAERLQGFPAGWTDVDPDDSKARKARWRMVGNAVSVPVAEWVGARLLEPEPYERAEEDAELTGTQWPTAAWGSPTKGRRAVPVSEWPLRTRRRPLLRFLRNPAACKPLSARAAAGFLNRLGRGTLRVGGAREALIDAMEQHIEAMSEAV